MRFPLSQQNFEAGGGKKYERGKLVLLVVVGVAEMENPFIQMD